MNICVFGASSAHIDELYIEEVERLGEELAARGHKLVFGAGATGLMGAVARGAKRAGGAIHGVVPSFFTEREIERLFTDCDELDYTETMRERKAIMEDDADAFIITPGGIGTLEEFYEVLTLKQLGRHDKAIVVLDIDGYFEGLQAFMSTACERRFITEDCLELYTTVTSVEEALDYVEGYVPQEISISRTKLGE